MKACQVIMMIFFYYYPHISCIKMTLGIPGLRYVLGVEQFLAKNQLGAQKIG